MERLGPIYYDWERADWALCTACTVFSVSSDFRGVVVCLCVCVYVCECFFVFCFCVRGFLLVWFLLALRGLLSGGEKLVCCRLDLCGALSSRFVHLALTYPPTLPTVEIAERVL